MPAIHCCGISALCPEKWNSKHFT